MVNTKMVERARQLVLAAPENKIHVDQVDATKPNVDFTNPNVIEYKAPPLAADSQEQLMLDARPGMRLDIMKFGNTPAILHCVERVTSPTLIVRFRVFVFNVEVGEVSIEQQKSGALIFKELS